MHTCLWRHLSRAARKTLLGLYLTTLPHACKLLASSGMALLMSSLLMFDAVCVGQYGRACMCTEG